MVRKIRVLTEGTGNQKANRDLALRFLLNYFDDAQFIDSGTIRLAEWGTCHVAAYTSSKAAMVSSATAENTEFGSREWHFRDHNLMFRDVGDGRCFVYICDIKTLLEQRKSGTHFVVWDDVRKISKKTLVFKSELVAELDSKEKIIEIDTSIRSIGKRWSRDETLLALELYCSLPFGKLDKNNESIKELAEKLGRTPSSIAMKACNFASLDDSISQKGLQNASQLDRDIWEEFKNNSTQMLIQSEQYKENNNIDDSGWLETLEIPNTETTSEAIVKVRKVQRFFRKAVLQSYGNRCAISNVDIPEFLIASHIIPWSVSEEKRADPSNGIALNSLYDKAFDRGFISFDDDYRLLISKSIRGNSEDKFIKRNFLDLEGFKLNLPEKFKPSQESLEWHRNNFFNQKN